MSPISSRQWTGTVATYRKVSHRWLQGYLNEFVWRRNARYNPTSILEALLDEATR